MPEYIVYPVPQTRIQSLLKYRIDPAEHRYLRADGFFPDRSDKDHRRDFPDPRKYAN